MQNSTATASVRRPPGPATPVALGIDAAALDTLVGAQRDYGDAEIAGYAIAEGTDLYLSPNLMQHDARRWPKPERFEVNRIDVPRPEPDFSINLRLREDIVLRPAHR